MKIVLVNQEVQFDDEQTARFRAIFRQRFMQNGEYFMRAGDRSTRVGTVMQGLFRSIMIDENGHDITKYFYPEGSVLFSYDAYIENTAASYDMQVLENSELLVAHVDDFIKFLEEDEPMALIFKRVMDEYILMKDRHASSFVLYNGTERYRNFLLEHPGLEKRIRQYHLASYLGITPVSLSRIRKKAGLNKC